MKHLVMMAVASAVFVSLMLGQAANTANSLDRSFADGGLVQLKLSSGTYTVRAGDSDHIVLRWQAADPSDIREMKKVSVRADVSGRVATIRTEGPTKNMSMVIEIPTHSDLYMRLRAGDVRIGGIEGNKDISMTAGDLKIDVLPDSYSHMHGSVTFGDVSARPLGIYKDGIRTSFDWNGTGKYTLRASLFAGDLILAEDNAKK